MSSSELASSITNSNNEESDSIIPVFQQPQPEQPHPEPEQNQEQQSPSPLSSQQHHQTTNALGTSEDMNDSTLSSPTAASPVSAGTLVLPPTLQQQTTSGMTPLDAADSHTTSTSTTMKTMTCSTPGTTTTTNNNNTVNTSVPPTPPVPPAPSTPSAPVQAYAKLEGEDFCYYIRTLQVTLGRKAAASTPNNVDIPLGNTKSVSRHHARLFYNFTTQRFEMMVFGKNGALVNERFVECGATVPLENRTKIQIGDVAFVFLLPRLMDLDDKVNNNGVGVGGTEKHHHHHHHHHHHGSIGNTNGNSDKDRQGDYISTPRQLEKNGPECITTTTLDHLNKKQRKRPLLQKKQQRSSSSADATSSSSSSSPATATTTGISGMESGLSDDFGNSTYSPTPGSYSDKNIKPPYSYAAIIAQAINSCPEKKMTLSSIYAYITHQYPYYQMTQNGWQNSIRHNLSLNKAFIKVPRQKDEPGKGAFWAIDPNVDPQFLNGIYKRNKRSSPQQPKSNNPSDNNSNNDATPLTPSGNNDVLPSSPTITEHPEKRIKLEHVPPPPPPPSSSLSSSPTSTSLVSPTSPMDTNQTQGVTTKEEDTDDCSMKMERTDMAPPLSTSSSPLLLPTITTTTTTTTVATATMATATTPDTSEMNQRHTKKEMSPPLPPPPPPAAPTPATAASITTTTIIPPPAPSVPSVISTPPPAVSPAVSSPQVPTDPSNSTPPSVSAPGMQTQLQVQLQQTIRQHLLDPVRNPLPPSIAQLLPQAIAQLPPALRTQLSATLQAALNAHQLQPSQQQQSPPATTPNTTNSTPLTTHPTESPPTTTTATANEKP